MMSVLAGELAEGSNEREWSLFVLRVKANAWRLFWLFLFLLSMPLTSGF